MKKAFIEWKNGSGQPLAVGRIFCLGGNYVNHQKEMGALQKIPSIFVKVDGCFLTGDAPVIYPKDSEDFHFEGEFVILLDDVPPGEKPDWRHVLAVGCGLDLTKRDFQNQAKQKGRPWEMAKSFPGAARASEFVSVADITNLDTMHIVTRVNGEVRQSARLSDMILSVPEILEYLHAWLPLQKGDLVYTGTPEGVGPLKPGDRISVEIENLTSREWRVVE